MSTAALAPLSTTERVRTTTLLVFLAGALLTVAFTVLAAIVPALWSLAFIAAAHTPIAAGFAAYKIVTAGDQDAERA